MTQPLPTISDMLQKLEDRSFKSYKSRIRTFERIQARNRAWNTALIALATATTVASVGILVEKSMYGASGEALLAACAILSLAASLVVASLDYPGRAVKIEASYKDIQDVSSLAQAARLVGSNPRLEEYKDLHGRYSEIIRHSENHTAADFQAANGDRSWSRFASVCLSLSPYITLLLPGWLILQFACWVVAGSG